MTQLTCCWVTPLVFFVTAIPAMAGGLDVLATIPTARYTDGDKMLLRTTLSVALDTDRDGTSRHWKNPETGNRGRIKIVRTLRNNVPICRVARVTNYNGKPGTKTSVLITFCQEAGGGWAAMEAANTNTETSLSQGRQ